MTELISPQQAQSDFCAKPTHICQLHEEKARRIDVAGVGQWQVGLDGGQLHIFPSLAGVGGICKDYNITPQDTLATLKAKHNDLMAAEAMAIAEASPPPVVFDSSPLQPPPSAMPPVPPSARPQPLGIPGTRALQNIHQLQQQQIQQALGLK